jgi:hypothetical protein
VTDFTEFVAEEVALAWLEAVAWRLHNGDGRKWFKAWRTITADTLTKAQVSGLPEVRR